MSKEKAAKGSKRNIFTSIFHWMAKRKLLCIILSVVLICVLVITLLLASQNMLPGMANRKKEGTTYEFIRTVTLTKTSLDETVSTTGTVESAATSTVSYAGGNMGGVALTVKAVHVAVGDTVAAGDVIVTLDDSDIRSSIEDEEENMADRIDSAQKNYTKAQESYVDALNDYNVASSNENDAWDAFVEAEKAYNKVVESVKLFQEAYDEANAAMEEAGLYLNSYTTAKTIYDQATTNRNSAEATLTNAKTALTEAQNAYNAEANELTSAALTTAQNNLNSATVAYDEACLALTEAENNLAPLTDAPTSYEEAAQNCQVALTALNDMKTTCNYSTYETAYQKAKTTHETAYAQEKSAISKKESAQEQLESTQDTYYNSGISSTLEKLYEQLEAVQLKAETDGKITALNVSVGDTPSGVVATIQDTNNLKISVTIQEADIHNVSIGMPCRIQTDATNQVISGTLSQIDPVSSQGVFGAEVTVDDLDSGLLVGMNASVEIVLTSTEDCFSVPQDAVGNDDDGKGDYIYRSTGGTGTDMTFEKIYVTTGQSNDYYIEITADELSVGDIIRATADLTQGIESSNTENESGNGFNMMPGGNMPSGGGMPDFGGGNMPSGGGMPDFGGGNMPSGGGMPDFGGGAGGGFPR